MARVDRYANLIEALEAAPAHAPFLTHWVDEDESHTVPFAEFRARAAAQAAFLQQNGIRPADRVIILMPQTITAMAAFAGAMMLGAIPAFLAYPNFKVEAGKYRSGLTGVTANLRARAVLIDADFPQELLGHIAVPEETPVLRISENATGHVSLTPGASDSIALIQHSAGTTGLQKGVALTHASILRHLQQLAAAIHLDPASDRIYSWLPLYHDMGLIACFLLPMVCHVPVVFQSPLDWVMQPESMLQAIAQHRCTLSWMPNFAFQFMPRRIPQNRWSQYDLSSVRALINCSEPVRVSSMAEFEGAFSSIGLRPGSLHTSYAMAENVFAVSQSPVDGPGPARVAADGRLFRSEHRIVPVLSDSPAAVEFLSSGRLLPGNSVRVVNGAGDVLPPGEVGEILLQSDFLFTGYYNRPDLTSATFRDGWYCTGDLGFLYESDLYVVGRKKDLLIVGGENLYPQDIEEFVATHPAVHDGRVVALGLYNPDLGTEDIVIVAEVNGDTQDGLEQIEQQIRSLVVAGTGVAPRRVLLKPAKWIVKSTAGKPARAATREKLLRQHPELTGDPVA